MDDTPQLFTHITSAEFFERRRDHDGDRIRAHELFSTFTKEDYELLGAHDTDDTMLHIVRGFATGALMRHRNRAVSFHAAIINAQPDEAFHRNIVDILILTESGIATPFRARCRLFDDTSYPALNEHGTPAAYWHADSYIPLDTSRFGIGETITEGFFTRSWPNNFDLRKLLEQSRDPDPEDQ